MKLTKIIAGILLVLAVALALLAWQLMRSQAAPSPAVPAATPASESAPSTAPLPAPIVPLHTVVVLAQAVPAGHKLTAEDVTLAEFPVPIEGAFSSTDPVIGQTTALALAPKAPIFEQNLLSGLALQLDPGQRALSIAVNEGMAAGNRVRPGDFVDVFVTLGDAQQQSPVDTQSRLLLARTRVLAYGGATVETPVPTPAQEARQEAAEQASRMGNGNLAGSPNAPNSASRTDPALRPENAKTAVLAIDLNDVQRLTLAEKYGQLTLALRHPDDRAMPDASLFAQLPPALRPVQAQLAKGQSLEGMDRAVAGLRFNDLATGGDAHNRKRPPSEPVSERTGPRRNTVEVHNGAAVQTVQY